MNRALPLLLLAACDGASVRSTAGRLEVPSALTFESTFVGHPSMVELPLRNQARYAREVQLSVGAPFSVAPSVSLGGGESVAVPVTVTPSMAGPLTGTLEVTVDGESFTVALEGTAVSPPSCEASECVERHFVPGRGCVEVPRPEGSACGASDRCLVNAVCRHGECVGAPRVCDDADACTGDACAPEVGCTHTPLACAPSTNPCLASVCDPLRGCQAVPVLDGTSCGANDCRTAQVCVSGACVARQAPEGSICAPATTCHAESRCVSGSCAAPANATPPVAWSRPTPADRRVISSAVARDGTVVFFEGPSSVQAPPVLFGIDPSGTVRFQVDLATDFPQAVPFGISVAIDEAHALIISSVRTSLVPGPGTATFVTARDLHTGALRWARDLTPIIPLVDGPRLSVDVFRIMRIGPQKVGALVSEGNSLHVLHVVAFDAVTGTVAFRVQQSGHGGASVAANGTLFFAAAPCWTSNTTMASYDADGHLIASRAMPVGVAMATRDGAMLWSGTGHEFWTADLTQSSPVPLPMGHSLGGSFVWRDGHLTAATKANGGFVTRSHGAMVDWTTRVTSVATDFVTLQGLSERRIGVTISTSSTTTPSQLVVLSDDGTEVDRCTLRPQVGATIAGGVIVTQSARDFTVYRAPTLDSAQEGWVGSSGGPQAMNSAL